ncbi:hypothetical protein NT01EI_2204 [Edwardsiella ictaluri 93-146]|uniref:Uncharacterized protein n=1 Tax=Edwardsiella ictaluri (strain 93-146) TaxID=634503 RepID=C5BFV2_EDWI9|nr:hypothetical protein NT01EI_2204 [Edwardsiella ictaluri 93-146]
MKLLNNQLNNMIYSGVSRVAVSGGDVQRFAHCATFCTADSGRRRCTVTLYGTA